MPTPKTNTSPPAPDAISETILTPIIGPAVFTFSKQDISFFSKHSKAEKYDNCKNYVRRQHPPRNLRNNAGRGEMLEVLYKQQPIADYVQQKFADLISNKRHINSPSTEDEVMLPQKQLGMG
jgi:hypothetical protein